MGLFDFSTGNAEADGAIGGIFSGLLDRGVKKILPAGSLSPNASASVARPSVQGVPSTAPEATFGQSWSAWAKKPVVWIIGGVVVILLAWKLFAKRGK